MRYECKQTRIQMEFKLIMVDRPEISTSEWQVMNVVWNEQPVTASEIIKRLAPQNN